MANIYKNSKLDLTTATATTLYTVPNNSRAIVKAILVTDDSNQSTDITINLFNGPPATSDKFTLFHNKTIAGHESLQLLTEPLIMLEDEVLEVTASAADRLYVVASILEINREDR